MNRPSVGKIDTSINQIKKGMDNILEKGSANNNDIIAIMTQIISLLIEQNKNIHEIITEMKTLKNDKIDRLDEEIRDTKII